MSENPCSSSIFVANLPDLFRVLLYIATVWILYFSALEAQSKLGGEDLIPFYGLLEGGRDGELFAELEDYFYYAQLRQLVFESFPYQLQSCQPDVCVFSLSSDYL